MSASGRFATIRSNDFLFRGRANCGHLTTRQYSRIVRAWVCELAADPSAYATHSKENEGVSYLGHS